MMSNEGVVNDISHSNACFGLPLCDLIGSSIPYLIVSLSPWINC